MKFLYVGDNSDSLNWGCRATSLALRQLIARRGEVIGTVQTGMIARRWPISDRMGDRPYARITRLLDRGRVRRLPIAGAAAGGIVDALGTPHAIGHDMAANLTVFDRARDYSPAMERLFAQIDACDALVVNGEGDLIFSTPARARLLFTLTVCRLAARRGKRIFYVNAIASAAPDSALNAETIAVAREVLADVELLSLRDPASLDFARAHLSDAATMSPDALFAWAPLFAAGAARFDAAALLPFFERTGHALPAALRAPYLLVGGSSRSAYDQPRSVQAYTGLVRALQTSGMGVVLAPACTGDRFLADVAHATGAALLPLDTPILACAAVLAHARAYVSGRWHPSIMASLGGTPCVFMGSNSHKTHAIQTMLGHRRPHEYSPWPDAGEIDAMARDVARLTADGGEGRAAILRRVAKLGREAAAIGDRLPMDMAA